MAEYIAKGDIRFHNLIKDIWFFFPMKFNITTNFPPNYYPLGFRFEDSKEQI
jgi:hypothetical protein